MSVLGRLEARDTRTSRWNLLFAGLCAAVAASVIVGQLTVRDTEAWVTKYLIAATTSGAASSHGPVIWFGIGTHNVVGLSITGLCSCVVLMAPLLALAAGILVIPGFRKRAVSISLIIALSLAIVSNVLRYTLAAVAYQAYGMDGFDFVHRYIGSLLVMVAFILAMLLLVTLAIRVSSRHRGPLRRATWRPYDLEESRT